MVEDVQPGDGVRAPWTHARGSMDLSRPRVMGILNVTPDSFSDGGHLFADGKTNRDAANDKAAHMRAAGADCFDVGGESTRPGARAVEPAEELARVLPVIEALAVGDAVVSVDTRRASVARAALSAGAAIVNDISGLADDEMAAVVASAGAGLVIGHLRGTPDSMQQGVRFEDLLTEVGDELCLAVERAVRAGVAMNHIVVDPGIGFGKTAEQSAALTCAGQALERMTGCPVLIGASRKSFLGRLSGSPGGAASQRLVPSVVAALSAVEFGAAVLRVHDVEETVVALRVRRGIERAAGAFDDRLGRRAS